jgi:CRP/FNR family cyclic AMP-dependent transcriptional regulator
MDPARIGQLLAATPSLSVLDSSDLAQLAASCRVRRVRRGQILFAEGDPADSLLVLASGRLRVLVSSVEGGQLVLRVIIPGDSVGEIGCLDGGPRSATVEAVQDSLLVQLSASDLLALVERRPQLALHLLTQLASDVRRLTGAAADLVFLDVSRRVAKLLVLEVAKAGTHDLELGETQGEIGDRVGGTRQSVNSALHTLERRGWLEVSSRHITIRDLEALQSFAAS